MDLKKIESFAEEKLPLKTRIGVNLATEKSMVLLWMPLLLTLTIACLQAGSNDNYIKHYESGLVKTDPRSRVCYNLTFIQCGLKVFFNKIPNHEWCNGYECREYLPKYWLNSITDLFDFSRAFKSAGHWAPPVAEPVQEDKGCKQKKGWCA